MSDWKHISHCPDFVPVLTKIDDENGCRNEQVLKKSANLFIDPSTGGYVYYQPTHFKYLE